VRSQGERQDVEELLILMVTNAKPVRKAMLRSSRSARKARKITSVVAFALGHRCFPITYFIRNMLTLQREDTWMHGSRRAQKNRLLRMIEERARIFLEVSKWLREKSGGEGWRHQIDAALAGPSLPSGYCSHCGGCCEIASGFPDFPLDTAIPPRWQRIFGDGLGRGHRFCAFLWELNASGRSLCAIHPWRSNPCRVFEEEECEYFMKDLEINSPFDPKAFSVACRRLSHLINR
jgi:hypothetical protein